MTTTTSSTSSTASTTAATTASTSTSTSASSIGASIINTLSAGSGVDTDALVTSLTAAQKTSLESGITTKQTANAAQISSLASISSDMSTFSSSLNTLITGGTLFTQPNSSDTTTLTVSAITGARLGDLSSQVEVQKIAKAQTIESQGITDPTASLGNGTLTITVNGTSKPVTVGGTGGVSTLAQLASAITASGAGVTASVVTDSGGAAHLVVKGATGSAQAFSVTSSDADLKQFTFDTSSTAATGSANGMGLNQGAQDAVVVVDGVSYTRSSNTFSDVVPGVKMNLLNAKPGSTITLGSTRPTDAITQSVNDFVSAYNTLKSELTTATAAATSSTASGPLRGNTAVRDMQRKLAQLTTTPLTASGNITTLAQIGVKTNQDGTLSVDSSALSTALTNYPGDVEALFNPQQSSSSTGVTIGSAIGKVATGTYSITNITPASGGTAASASINGVAGTGSGSAVTAAVGSSAAGLFFSIASGAPSSATFSIDQGLAGALQSISDALTGTGGTLTTLQTSLQTQATTLATQLTAADAKVTVYHDRLVDQFATMNTRVSAFKATQSYLTQQVALWDKSD